MLDKFKRKIQWILNIYHLGVGWGFVMVNGFPARKLVVIGVTGTDGKTTTCHLIYETLRAAGYKVALISTVAAYVGQEEIDTGFHITSPDARTLQSLLRKIVDLGFSHLVLETTSHGLDQHRVVGCNFAIGVITNITHEHLDYHGTFERYRAAKAKLILNAKYSILNENDASFEYLKARSRGKVIPYKKTIIKITNPKLAGEYNKYNVGAALAVAQILNLKFSIFKKVIDNFPGVPGRLEEVRLGQPFRVVVDFAHTANALEQVLVELKRQKGTGKKLILVFGCAGLRDFTKRPVMGKVATKLADKVIITAEDPRTESLQAIYGQITAGLTGAEMQKMVRIDDRQQALNWAMSEAGAGDIVVATGKGHEKSMCFGRTEVLWSDREAIQSALHTLSQSGNAT